MRPFSVRHCRSRTDHAGHARRGVVWAALALLCAAPLAAADNLLPNPSFEELDPQTGMPAEWTNWATPNTAVYTLAAARTGVACVAITDDSEAVSQGLRSPRVAVEPGVSYRASAWVKIERIEKGAFALYLEYWQGPTRIENRSVSTARALDWVELALAYPAPAGATHATVLVYSSSVTVGRAYFDDAALVAEE